MKMTIDSRPTQPMATSKGFMIASTAMAVSPMATAAVRAWPGTNVLPDPSAVGDVHDREQGHVGHVAAHEVTDGQIGRALQDGTDCDGDLGQGRRGCHQDHADQQTAQAGAIGDAITRLREQDAGAHDQHRHRREQRQPTDQGFIQGGPP